jgi:hypothetical protein
VLGVVGERTPEGGEIRTAHKNARKEEYSGPQRGGDNHDPPSDVEASANKDAFIEKED